MAISWLIVVTVLLCLPGQALPDTGGDWFTLIYGDKWIHIFLFGVLTFLFCPFTGKYSLVVLVATVAYGILMEFIQLWLISGRGFEMADIAADTVGSALGCLIFRYKSRRYIKK